MWRNGGNEHPPYDKCRTKIPLFLNRTRTGRVSSRGDRCHSPPPLPRPCKGGTRRLGRALPPMPGRRSRRLPAWLPHDPRVIEDTERARVSSFFLGVFKNFESAWFQMRHRTLDPVNISLLRSRAVAVEANCLPHPIQQLGRFRTRRKGIATV